MLQRGFTLIELLVVIAIIGILASVVLASLNTARDKGADAAIKSTINNVRAEAELYYDDNSSEYSGLCATLTEPQNNVNNTGGANTWTCNAATSSYAISGQLSDDTSFYCVDSSGDATTTSAAVTAPTC